MGGFLCAQCESYLPDPLMASSPYQGRVAGRWTEVLNSLRAGCCRAHTCPQASTVPTSCSAAVIWEPWGASPNWGGLPAVSPFLRTYQK